MKYAKITLIIVFILLTTTSSSIFAQRNDGPYTIGYLVWFFDSTPFREEMTGLGYVEGENVTYVIPSFENMDENTPFEEFTEHFNAQVQLMVDAGVDVLVTNTDTDAVNLQSITGDIPIVFARSDDPVATGAVADLVNPGGHITGIVTNRPHERRLQILTEIKPATKKVFYLYSPFTLEAETVLQQVQAVAESLDVEVIPAPVMFGSYEVLDEAPEDIDWLFLTPFVPFDFEFFGRLAAVSASRQAGISWVTNDPMPGYLMGYGPDIAATDRQAAQIVDRILRGANPADLPVQTAENYLMVNLEAAEAIGMEIPLSILRQADLIVRPGFFDTFISPFGSFGN